MSVFIKHTHFDTCGDGELEAVKGFGVMYVLYRSGVFENFLLEWLREQRNNPYFQERYPGYRSPLQ